jgi:pimeloyl-ACP methyl ester carboxylesterase
LPLSQKRLHAVERRRLSSSSSPGRSPATSSYAGPYPNSRPSWSGCAFCRVLLFDKAGVGRSDPVPQVRTLDDRAAEIEAVMAAAGFGRAVLFSGSEGGSAAIVFAATRPKRTRALILTGTFSYFGFDGRKDLNRDPAELRARLVPELGDDYTPAR